MLRIVLFSAFGLVVSYMVSEAQTVQPLLPPPGYVEKIKETVYREHLFTLAADSMEGRAMGTTGQKKAALYIENELKKAGLEVHRQAFDYVPWYTIENLSLHIDGKTYDIRKQQLVPYIVPDAGSRQWTKKARIATDGKPSEDVNIVDVFFWHEKDFASYEALDMTLKMELLPQMPFNKTVIVVLDFEKNAGKALLKKFKHNSGYHYLKPPGKNIFIVPASFAGEVDLSYPKELLVRQDIKGGESQTTENIIGIVRGQQAFTPQEEFVVLSAHYDHLGIRYRKVYNGADDNASGTAGLLSIARACAMAARNGHKPKRSMLFVFFTGEEGGLHGSRFFTTYPPVPLQQIVADVNVDMIGRVDKQHAGRQKYVYLIGGRLISHDLHRLVYAVNKACCGFYLDEYYNSLSHPESLFTRSDHYNFAVHDIPVVFFFSGFHEDYHKHSDDPEKINVARAVLISRLVFQVGWALAEQDTRPRVTYSFSKYKE